MGYDLEWLSTKHSQEVYGDDRKVLFAVPCPYCKGAQWLKIANVKKYSRLPVTFLDKSLNDFKWDIYCDENGKVIDTTYQRQIVNSFIKDFEEWDKKGIGLYLYSDTKGTGKTMLSSIICNELMNKRALSVYHLSCCELISVSETKIYDKNNGYDVDAITYLTNCKLLVLDDLGQQNNGGKWNDDLFYRIINARNERKLSTIITSNRKIGDLQDLKIIDERTISRINEMTVMVHLPELTIRTIKAKEEKENFLKTLGINKG